MKPSIVEGDTVSVSFHGSQYTHVVRGIVVHVPVATGDSWIIEEDLPHENNLHYISEGCTITKTKQKTLV